MPKDPEYADRVIAEAMRQATAGLNLQRTGLALEHAQEAMLLQAKALAEAKYDETRVMAKCPHCNRKHLVIVPQPDVTQLARALAHTTGMIDDIARLQEFAKGQPDHRVDHGTEFLKYMTESEIRVVQERIAAGKTA